jgi:hypothetical protein
MRLGRRLSFLGKSIYDLSQIAGSMGRHVDLSRGAALDGTWGFIVAVT